MAITATAVEIEALRKAIASGVLSVRHGGVETTFDSFKALVARYNQLTRAINPSRTGPRAGFASFDRGENVAVPKLAAATRSSKSKSKSPSPSPTPSSPSSFDASASIAAHVGVTAAAQIIAGGTITLSANLGADAQAATSSIFLEPNFGLSATASVSSNPSITLAAHVQVTAAAPATSISLLTTDDPTELLVDDDGNDLTDEE